MPNSLFNTYVINLDRSKVRLAAISEHLTTLEIPFQRIRAIDARNLDIGAWSQVDMAACRRMMGRDLSDGEFACYLSHKTALQHIANSEAPFGLILEDDAVLVPKAKMEIGSICDALFAKHYNQIRLVNLGRRASFLSTNLVRAGTCEIKLAHYAPMGAFATLWTKQGAIEFLQLKQPIAAPFDNTLQNWLCKSGGGLTLAPPIANVASVDSDIDGSPAGASLRRGRSSRQRFHGLTKQKRLLRNRIWAAYHKIRALI